jgi:hypothetical protein
MTGFEVRIVPFSRPQQLQEIPMRSIGMISAMVALAAAPLAAQGSRFRTDTPDPRRVPATVDGQILPQDQQASRKSQHVPPGQMPPAGMCRIWIDGVPPGQQPAPTDCQTAVATKPANARVIWGDQSAFPGKGKGKFDKAKKHHDDDEDDDRGDGARESRSQGTVLGRVIPSTPRAISSEKARKGKGKGRGGDN